MSKRIKRSPAHDLIKPRAMDTAMRRSALGAGAAAVRSGKGGTGGGGMGGQQAGGIKGGGKRKTHVGSK